MFGLKATDAEVHCINIRAGRLETRVKELEKLCRKEYDIWVNCLNCGQQQKLTVAVGVVRPSEYMCNYCKCTDKVIPIY